MKHLEVSGAVRALESSLGVKRLMFKQFSDFDTCIVSVKFTNKRKMCTSEIIVVPSHTRN